MKRIFRITLSILAILIAGACLFSCAAGTDNGDGNSPTPGNQNTDKPGDSVSMVARVTELGDRITVEVIESPYTSGVHWVITAPTTEYYAKDGTRISREDIKVGDKVEILYSGQVMMSLPPQIVAARISVVE